MKKPFTQQLAARIRGLVLKVLSPSFLTWGLLFWALATKRIPFDPQMFLLFTATVIGLKKYLEKDKPTGGMP
jgi:hypothetical protein